MTRHGARTDTRLGTVAPEASDAPSVDRQAALAEHFRALHKGQALLVLPNAWDALSARIFELEGFPAVATTSAGIAASLGYRDDESVGVARMADRLQEICRVVAIPVSADISGGFASAPDAIGANVRTFVAQGVVGINIEDRGDDGPASLRSTSAAQATVRAARLAGNETGVPIVINARTDSLMHGPITSTGIDHAVGRAVAYLEAGADCIFVPGPIDVDAIAELAGRIPGPLNVLLKPGSPSLEALAAAGVRRVTFGSWPMRAAYSLVRRYADDLRKAGSLDALADNTLSHADLQALFGRAAGTLETR